MDSPEAELFKPVGDYWVSWTNRVAVARKPRERRNVEVIGMAMGDYQNVNGRKLLKVDHAFGTRNNRALLERIEKDGVHQAGRAIHFDQNRSMTQQGYFHDITPPETGSPALVSQQRVPRMVP
jgi:hypothetical protein